MCPLVYSIYRLVVVFLGFVSSLVFDILLCFVFGLFLVVIFWQKMTAPKSSSLETHVICVHRIAYSCAIAHTCAIKNPCHFVGLQFIDNGWYPLLMYIAYTIVRYYSVNPGQQYR
jgi:hypothetical protein